MNALPVGRLTLRFERVFGGRAACYAPRLIGDGSGDLAGLASFDHLIPRRGLIAYIAEAESVLVPEPLSVPATRMQVRKAELRFTHRDDNRNFVRCRRTARKPIW